MIELRLLSARTGLSAKQWSFVLPKFALMLAVSRSIQDTAEQVNGDMGAAAGTIVADLPAPEPGSEAKLLVASADCKGVPLAKVEAAKEAEFEVSKRNPGNRRMSTVTSLYSLEPHVRTAEDVAAALFRDKPDARNSGGQNPEGELGKNRSWKNAGTDRHACWYWGRRLAESCGGERVVAR